jgi:hypothetical protein
MAAVTLVEREIVQRGQRTGRRDAEDRTTAFETRAAGATGCRCPIELTVGAYNQPRGRLVAVRAARLEQK